MLRQNKHFVLGLLGFIASTGGLLTLSLSSDATVAEARVSGNMLSDTMEVRPLSGQINVSPATDITIKLLGGNIHAPTCKIMLTDEIGSQQYLSVDDGNLATSELNGIAEIIGKPAVSLLPATKYIVTVFGCSQSDGTSVPTHISSFMTGVERQTQKISIENMEITSDDEYKISGKASPSANLKVTVN